MGNDESRLPGSRRRDPDTAGSSSVISPIGLGGFTNTNGTRREAVIVVPAVPRRHCEHYSLARCVSRLGRRRRPSARLSRPGTSS